jgi:hypothetical protein
MVDYIEEGDPVVRTVTELFSPTELATFEQVYNRFSTPPTESGFLHGTSARRLGLSNTVIRVFCKSGHEIVSGSGSCE